MWQSLLQAFRLLRKSPGFSAVAILTLALGIGANTAIFSVVNALLLRSLPLHEPGRLLLLAASRPQQNTGTFPFSVVAYETVRDRARSFSGVTAYASEGLTLTGAGDPEQLQGALVSPNFFDVLQAQPLLGRGFEPAEGEPRGKAVVLLSHKLWQRRFAGDPAILGKPVTLGQEVHTVIGVMPPDFPFPFQGQDLWLTGIANYNGLQREQIQHGAGYLIGIARLKPGMNAPAAAAEVQAIGRQYRQEHPGNPDADPLGTLDVSPLQDSLVSDIRQTLLILSGAVGLVLLIACANVAGLMLARATGRAREIALRAALGAGRGRLIRQLLAESLLLTALGAVLGVVLAGWVVSLIAAAPGVNLPAVQPIRVDLPVLAFTLAVSIFTGVLFGLMPALQVSRPDLNAVLRDSSRGTTGGGHRQRTRSLLVAGQMALSIVLLVGAGLLIESFRQLQSVRLGFDPHHGLSANIGLPPARYPDDARRAHFIHELMDRLEAAPGVRSASVSLGLPLAIGAMAPFLPDNQPAGPMGRRPLGVWNAISPDYFQTLGIPLLRGRAFTWNDDDHAPPRVVVSESLAKRFWPGQDAVGRRIKYARREIDAEIVGVAGDVKSQSLEADSGLVFYTPYPQFAWPGVTVTIRTAGEPMQFANTVRAQVLAIDRDLPVTNIRTLDDLEERVLATRRQTMYLIAGFAAVALMLALVGLYGAMSYSVTQRTAEFGIRQAIGAGQGDILRLVLAQGLRLTLAGIGLGAVAAAAMTRLLASQLYHVSAADPATFAAVAVLFLCVSLAAACIPAWRATRVDPLEALRSQ